MERWDECEALARTTGDRCRDIIGNDHLYTITVDGTYGKSRMLRGDFAGAEPVLRDVAERAQAGIGPDHWRAGRAIVAHGNSLTGLGRYEEAEEQLLKGQAIIAGVFDDDHRMSQTASRALAASSIFIVIDFASDGFSCRKSFSFSLTADSTIPLISDETSLSLVCEENFGSGTLTDNTAVNPSRASSPLVDTLSFLSGLFSM